MSLESIVNHILVEADSQKELILKEAKQQAESILKQAEQEAERLTQQIINQEKMLAEKERQKILVNARLEQKKNSLSAKQELIDAVFAKLKASLQEDRFKKQRIFKDKVQEAPEDIDFYLNRIRADCETEIAEILFSQDG